MGSPFLLPDFAALRALVDSEASVWKKCPGSVDRDMVEMRVVGVVAMLFWTLGSTVGLILIFYKGRSNFCRGVGGRIWRV